MGINLEIKGQLAKLLFEDLIIENKEITTSFNVDSRVLTLPIWDKADNNVYDLLVAPKSVTHSSPPTKILLTISPGM